MKPKVTGKQAVRIRPPASENGAARARKDLEMAENAKQRGGALPRLVRADQLADALELTKASIYRGAADGRIPRRIQRDVQEARKSGKHGAIMAAIQKHADKLGVSLRTVQKYAA